jgi:hypothetical protein
MKTRDRIIFDMCMTHRHDFGLDKDPDAGSLSSGMTPDEREYLISVMRQIFNNDIEWMYKELEDLHSGERIVLPSSRQHAESMIRVAQFYLDTHKEAE